jgi:hypothetical protein
LLPLAVVEALNYARRLVDVRHRNDPDLHERVLARVGGAAGEVLTARLMRTPLQVTIMSLLLERRPRAPQDRYGLFEAYYSTLYDREVGKGTDVARLLDENRGHVDHLHERVGMVLQARAESAGDADAALPSEELEQLAVARLTDEGISAEQASGLAARLVNDPANLESCVGCGRQRRVHTRGPHGPLCATCKSLPILDCSICGTTTHCGISRATGLPWCWARQRRSAACSACGRHSPIVSGTLADPLCTDCTPPPPWRDCPTCDNPDHPHPGQCARCLINRRLGELMGTSIDSLPAGLQALRHDIATTEHPITAMRWLTKPSIAPVLADLAAGRLALTHEALDELPRSQPLAHLRQTLVTVGALPERDEHLVRPEVFLTDLLAPQQDPEQRQILRRYTTWHLVRRLRARNNGHPATPQQCGGIRQRAQAAVAFLDWLRVHDLTLGTCRQADLDRWLTNDSATYRKTAGHFIRWARSNKLTTVHAAAIRWTGPTQQLDDQRRWELARRLLHDGHLKPEDRLAGLLLLLYAQTPAVISRLTTDHLNASPDHVRLRLGTAPIELPKPVADPARSVAANRKGHATIGALTPSPWLFPGGQPGRPISTTQLTHRLNNLGIRPNQGRSTALLQLATEVPAAILARTLGIHTDVAVAWQRLSAGDWTTYAAEVSQRTNRPARHSDSSDI